MISQKLRNEIKKFIKGKIKINTDVENVDKFQIKRPKTQIDFKEPDYIPNIWERAFSIYQDEIYCVVNKDNLYDLAKIEDVTDENSITIGAEWDGNKGRPYYMTVTNAGISILTEVDNSSEYNDGFYMWFLDNINDTNPDLVYQNETSEVNVTSNFGYDSYNQGFSRIILYGEYDHSDETRKLILSLDGGQNFEEIRYSGEVDTGDNSHFHDVAIHPEGYLFAIEGDEDNAGIFMSDDWGETWIDISKKLYRQPSTAMPFSDRVIFSRDSSSVIPGLDYFSLPVKEEDWGEIGERLHELKVFYTELGANDAYGRNPIYQGNEGYFIQPANDRDRDFHNEDVTNMRKIMGTKDGGFSFHSVYIFTGDTNDEPSTIVTNLLGLDDKYIYATGSRSGPGQSFLYAKKPKWY